MEDIEATNNPLPQLRPFEPDMGYYSMNRYKMENSHHFDPDNPFDYGLRGKKLACFQNYILCRCRE